MRTAISLSLAFALVAPAQAVIILDSTWAEEGGTPDNKGAGFQAHFDLANEPQFDALISFSNDDQVWGHCSGTWIGNDGDTAYVLTAGHCFDTGETASKYSYRTQGGTMLSGVDLYVHPEWTGNINTRMGYDIAIVTLDGPVTDGGPPPAIYAGTQEKDQILTFVGFGSRGIGSDGQHVDYYAASGQDEEKAAAQGRIDPPTDAVLPIPATEDEDAGNYLNVFFPKEDGSIPNPSGGESTPVNRLAGLLGTGDSGGSAWIEMADGTWVIAGINSWGSGNAQYGDASAFVRVSYFRDWIATIYPDATFVED